MDAVKTLLVGAGGYGAHYVKLFEHNIDPDRMTLCGVVDPTIEPPKDGWLHDNAVPFYDTMEAFYAKNSAQLAIIASPIPFHREQALSAISKGSSVLCEKPLVPRVSEAIALMQKAIEAGVTLGVGFQWSFCAPMRRLKADILAGDFGAPRMLKTFISWQRFDEYYSSSSWKGRICDSAGRLVNDSVATNATAHYLHNLFFILGDAIGHSAMPNQVSAEVYRAKDIETYDTCFMRGSFALGGEFFYAATHSGDYNVDPIAHYAFEKGDVMFSDNRLYAIMADGTVREYGDPQTDEACAGKIVAMLDNIQYGDRIPCGVPAVLPHLTVCRAVSLQCPVHEFADTYRDNGSFVHGLTADGLECYRAGKLPSEMGLSWAKDATKLIL